MTTIESILYENKQDIIDLAKGFGFDNISLLFDNGASTESLNLVVDVNASVGGDVNNANLLEAKLINLLNVDTTVLVRSKVTDIFNRSLVNDKSISIEADVEAIQTNIKKSLSAVVLKPNDIKPRALSRRLKLADKTLRALN